MSCTKEIIVESGSDPPTRKCPSTARTSSSDRVRTRVLYLAFKRRRTTRRVRRRHPCHRHPFLLRSSRQHLEDLVLPVRGSWLALRCPAYSGSFESRDALVVSGE